LLNALKFVAVLFSLVFAWTGDAKAHACPHESIEAETIQVSTDNNLAAGELNSSEYLEAAQWPTSDAPCLCHCGCPDLYHCGAGSSPSALSGFDAAYVLAEIGEGVGPGEQSRDKHFRRIFGIDRPPKG
jgi:hypothetical protein